MNIYRTPESRFKDLADFPFSPNYLHIDDGKGAELRMHYIDEGPKRWAHNILRAWPAHMVLLLSQNDPNTGQRRIPRDCA